MGKKHSTETGKEKRAEIKDWYCNISSISKHKQADAKTEK